MRTLIDEYLAAQRRLETPVARFSEAHDAGTLAPPALEPVYRNLLPLSAPKPGEQYAFEVELDACTGCKACVSACHSLNGLDENETWRDVGLLLGAEGEAGWQQTVTTACHHCAEPGCLEGCPVLAYEKDPATGIVRHLDDQCIGCQYCVLKCPYDVPKYNGRLGIVRKCDMCHGRLAVGEAPACVQACPTQAIRIVTVPIAPAGRPAAFLPGAPAPDYTRPSTRYVSAKPLPAGTRASDSERLRIEPAHWPLVLMLVLTQAALGALGGALVLQVRAGETPSSAAAGLLGAAALATLAGLGASVAHLGQPLKAWRAFLGLRRSWMSREIVVFGGFAPLLLTAWASAQGWLPIVVPHQGEWLTAAAFASGLLGVFCSAMIYVDTRREFWAFRRSVGNFFGTALTLGLAAAWVVAQIDPQSPAGAASLVSLALAVVTALKLLLDARFARRSARLAPSAADRKSLRLLRGPLRRAWVGRGFTRALGGGLFPLLALASPDSGLGLAVVSLVLLVGSELCERYSFFRAVVAWRMPGLPAS